MSLPAWILSVLFVASLAAVSCGDDDDSAAQTATDTATVESKPSPGVDKSVLPTPPPGLAARFLDPEEVLPAHISSAEYESYLALVEELMADVDEFWEQNLESETDYAWHPPELVERIPNTPIQCDETDVQSIRGSFF
ncbi:MAG TPA: hypothetical protein VFZ12_02410, partial [Dehalococcoidia bacterium]|nr:hypothetical protein [Dehalococcoidia bacterium]